MITRLKIELQPDDPPVENTDKNNILPNPLTTVQNSNI